MEIGMKIRSLRKEKGYSQEYMAQELNMSQNNYSKIELGEIRLTIDRVKQIAEILDTDIFSLIGGDKYVFNNHHQAGGTASSMTINNHYADKFIAYLENQIVELKAQLLEKDSQIELLEKQQKA